MGELPVHLAVIPDGNRRWARQQGVSTTEGHAAGYKTLKVLADAAFSRGIQQLTAYAFSTENWKRSSAEVGALMRLAAEIIKKEGPVYEKKGIRLRFLGSESNLATGLAKGLRQVESDTAKGQNGTLNLCFNYGARGDIVHAVREVVSAQLRAEDVSEDAIENNLSTAGIPSPDLIIRTGGERRLSNFLLWEAAYSELYFVDTLWPDFNEADLDAALSEYSKRKRNFGR